MLLASACPLGSSDDLFDDTETGSRSSEAAAVVAERGRAWLDETCLIVTSLLLVVAGAGAEISSSVSAIPASGDLLMDARGCRGATGAGGLSFAGPSLAVADVED